MDRILDVTESISLLQGVKIVFWLLRSYTLKYIGTMCRDRSTYFQMVEENSSKQVFARKHKVAKC